MDLKCELVQRREDKMTCFNQQTGLLSRNLELQL
jgi:hypothetical protein